MRITLIGSGNVATHLAAAFKNAGHRIVQVYSRDMQRAALLAYHVNAEPISDLRHIDAETDLFIISVKDDAIAPVANHLANFKKLTVHTSGATDMESLAAVIPQAGVFYPLQTFSKEKEIDFWSVPLCIEGVDEAVTSELEHLAQTISNRVYRINSNQRKTLHLAAVFACNFPNYLYDVARNLLAKNNMEFELLRPLILETAQKVQDSLPADLQTGPAVREDELTMANHLQMLENEPQLKMIYELLSQGIITNRKPRH
ncbi:MAG TPA: Rossmann-like and DUF2520 domain-containing protein [Mucilaginibacter sp.]|jgi:predicted short-subunit dehydrogenase-like oxidoreductase (DUF2520 family)|nr:Rossmann-like and DUF2520 domain-containing protein [Mucilaginibacter sp.]